MPSGLSWVEYPHARIRKEIVTHRGDVIRFVVQLEYNLRADVLEADDWRQVARFDHDGDAEMGHDVREEGLHMDVYCEGEKVDVRRDFPDVPVRRAPGYCVEYFERHADWLLDRFERWHGVEENRNDYS